MDKQLTIVNAAEQPSVVVAGQDELIPSVDYGPITMARHLAMRAYKVAAEQPNNDLADTVKDLSDAVSELALVLEQIVRGLDKGKLYVINYPVDGAHLDSDRDRG